MLYREKTSFALDNILWSRKTKCKKSLRWQSLNDAERRQTFFVAIPDMYMLFKYIFIENLLVTAQRLTLRTVEPENAQFY